MLAFSCQQNMSQHTHIVYDYSDSEDEFDSRIQCRISPWAQWSSESMISALEDAGKSISQGLSREDLLLLAQNTLGNPPVSISLTKPQHHQLSQNKPAGRELPNHPHLIQQKEHRCLHGCHLLRRSPIPPISIISSSVQFKASLKRSKD